MWFCEETLGETHGQRVFARACFGATKKAVFSVEILKDEGRVVAVMWSSRNGEFQ